MIGGGARRMIEAGLQHQGRPLPPARRRPDVRRFHSRITRPTSPTARSRSPASTQRSIAWPRAAAALRSAPTSSKDCRGCCSMRSASPGALPRSAARTHSGCKSPTRRSCGGPSARPAATLRRAVMVGDSGTDIATARAAGVPVVAVDFGYSETPIRELGADRLISHFDELAAAVLELAPPDAVERRECPAKATLGLYLPYLGHTGRRGSVPAAMRDGGGIARGLYRSYLSGGPLSHVTRPLGCMSGRYWP